MNIKKKGKHPSSLFTLNPWHYAWKHAVSKNPSLVSAQWQWGWVSSEICITLNLHFKICDWQGTPSYFLSLHSVLAVPVSDFTKLPWPRDRGWIIKRQNTSASLKWMKKKGNRYNKPILIAVILGFFGLFLQGYQWSQKFQEIISN